MFLNLLMKSGSYSLLFMLPESNLGGKISLETFLKRIVIIVWMWSIFRVSLISFKILHWSFSSFFRALRFPLWDLHSALMLSHSSRVQGVMLVSREVSAFLLFAVFCFFKAFSCSHFNSVLRFMNTQKFGVLVMLENPSAGIWATQN